MSESRKYGFARWDDMDNFTQHGGVKKVYSLAMDCKNVVMSVGVFGPGEGIPLHNHKELEELFYVISGSVRMTIEDDVVDLQEGDAVSVPAQLNRKMENVSTQACKILFAGAPIEAGMFDKDRKFETRA